MHRVLGSVSPLKAAMFSRESVSSLSHTAGFRLRTVKQTLQMPVSDEQAPADMPNPHVNRRSFLGAKVWEVEGAHASGVLSDLPGIGLIFPEEIRIFFLFFVPPTSHGYLICLYLGATT